MTKFIEYPDGLKIHYSNTFKFLKPQEKSQNDRRITCIDSHITAHSSTKRKSRKPKIVPYTVWK